MNNSVITGRVSLFKIMCRKEFAEGVAEYRSTCPISLGYPRTTRPYVFLPPPTYYNIILTTPAPRDTLPI